MFACVFICSACIKEPAFDQIKYVNTLDASINVKKVLLNGEYCIETNGEKNTWECAFKVGFDSLLKDSWFVCSVSTSEDFYKRKPADNRTQFEVEIEPDVYDTTYYYCAVLRKKDKELAAGEVRTIYFGNPNATITTIPVSDITATSAKCGGIVNNSGNAAVTARGICWSTSHNPTINGRHTTDGSGTGNFTSTMTGLSPNTAYFVRAYATNSAGTSYGNERGFTTSPPGLPTVTTSSVSNITTSSATCGGSVTNNGGATVTARGICWSTSHNPTTISSHTTNGSGTGAFTGSITGLSENTTYYVRAYATNSAGTAYGAERTFTTLTLPTVTTSAVSNITTNSATCGGTVTNSGNATVTARGVCWSTSHNPTISNIHTTNGSGTGTFTSSITGLSANTTYYLRAYAKNSAGTAYGEERSFTTTSGGGNTPAGWVDLGLPSGLLWAECNLGATTPEGYGNYYAWGETSTKSNYSWSTYRYGSDYNKLTKYCSNSSYGLNGFTDNLTTLQSGDDAATAVLGNGARMPTKAEWQELLNNTTATWTTQNGVYGQKFTAANGSSLFLPAAGYRNGSSLRYAGEYGYYWSSSLDESYPDDAWYVSFGSDGQYVGSYGGRDYGRSVRAVRSQN